MKGSFRARLFAGAFVWMIAVLVAVSVLVIRITRSFPAHREPRTYFAAMGIIAIAFLLGGWILVRSAVTPFRDLRSGLLAVRNGQSQRIAGRYPAEVQPLVNELNAMLEERERAIARALATAGDLAHGLKTPLAMLAQEAEQARAVDQHDLANLLREQIERMQRQIDYHLARARATALSPAAPGHRCAVLPSVEGLVRTMRRLYAGRELTIGADVSREHEIRGRKEDLDEMLGNLMDNACKWARSRVVVSSMVQDAHLLLTIDDDGPGIDPSLRDGVLQRGVRADQQAGGSGLGLAIVRELAELSGGSVALETSPLGGTRARLQLPRF